MAVFRKVHTAFWTDSKVIEEMTPEDKFFYLYILTNSNTSQIGIYEITKKQIAFEMGYSIESISALMDRFENHHRLIKYNSETREICILNWGRFNLDNTSKPMIDCIKSEIPKVKDKNLLLHIANSTTKDSIKDLILNSYELSTDFTGRDTGRSTSRGEEQEEEQEEEEEEQQQEEGEKENIVVVTPEKIEAVLKILENKINYQSANTILKAANNNLDIIKEKYELSKLSEYKNLGGWMVKAIKEDWKILGQKNNNVFKTKFHNFEQRSSKYSKEDINNMVLERQRNMGLKGGM